MGESKVFYGDDRTSIPSPETLHDDHQLALNKRRIYRQMDLLVRDLQQGTQSDGGGSLAMMSDEDHHNGRDNIIISNNNSSNSSRRLAPRKNSVTYSLLRPAVSEVMASGEPRLLRRLMSACENTSSHGGQGHSWTKACLASAMAAAIDLKRIDLLEILLEEKASASGSHQGQCHLARAVRTGNYDIVKRLVEAGADVNAEVDNKSVLHIAASTSSADVIQCLLDHGGGIEAIDCIQGNTALHVACSYCNAGAARALILNGAEFNRPNFQGDSPLAKLLRHITKNKHDWHNNQNLKLAKALIETGLMIFPSDDYSTTVGKRKHGRKSSPQKNQHHSSFTPPLLSSNFPPLSNSPSPIQMCSERNSGSRVSRKYLPRSPHEMFSSLVRSLEEFDEDRENMDEFPVLSSSPSSSSLSSSSSSSLSSCESSFSLAEEPQTLSPTSSPERSRSYPWWKTKEAKMFQLYDEIASESRASWSLQQHCRLRVLRCLATRSLRSSVASLGLPRMVQRYLIYGHLASFEIDP